MDDLFSSPASATAAAAAGSLQTSTAGDLGAVGGADNSSTHRAAVEVPGNAEASSKWESYGNVHFHCTATGSPGVTAVSGHTACPRRV